jgi:hypothetical protein
MRRAILPLLLASAACTPAVTDTRIEPNAVPRLPMATISRNNTPSWR